MDYNLIMTGIPCAPCWSSLSRLFHIAGQKNYRTANSLFSLQSFGPMTWGLLFHTKNYSQSSSLLTHWFILNHIQWSSWFLYFICVAFESFFQAIFTKKPTTTTCEHSLDAHLPCLSTFISFLENRLIWWHENFCIWILIQGKISCPFLSLFFKKPYPINCAEKTLWGGFWRLNICTMSGFSNKQNQTKLSAENHYLGKQTLSLSIPLPK